MPRIEFWFEFASTYSHIAAHRIEPLARQAGVEVIWRPFLLGPVFQAQGWTDSPFNIYPAKGAYMWQDMARECARLDIPFKRPSRMPRNGLRAARIATAAEGAPWRADFVRGVYRANFVEDRDIADPNVLHEVLRDIGVSEPLQAMGAATGDRVKRLLRERTEEAQRLGIFGAPSFMVNGTLFWGTDRLEQALAWAL